MSTGTVYTRGPFRARALVPKKAVERWQNWQFSPFLGIKVEKNRQKAPSSGARAPRKKGRAHPGPDAGAERDCINNDSGPLKNHGAANKKGTPPEPEQNGKRKNLLKYWNN